MLKIDFSKKKTKRIYFCLILVIAVVAAAFFAAAAAQKSGSYWANFNNKRAEANPQGSDGFLVVDVSDLSSQDKANSGEQEETQVVPIGVGPVPNVPALTEEELKLYGVLSKSDGLLTSEDQKDLDEDIHWQEVVLEPGDTIKSIAAKFGVSPRDIIKANGFSPKQKLETAAVIYVPDSHEYVSATHSYIASMKHAEQNLAKGGTPLSITAYVVQSADTVWSVASKFNLNIDTILGSNKIKNIAHLKAGTTLRIPNQNGIYIRVAPGDTISELADKYGSYTKAIMSVNKISKDSDLRMGAELFLPGAQIAAIAETYQTNGNGKVVRATASRIIREVARRGSYGYGSGFRWPVMGEISSPFGWRRSPFGSRMVFHAGLDISAPRGRPIVAAADGVVIHSGWINGYGNAIVIEHGGGVETLYGHCSALVVNSGVRVSRGQVIALVGSTGRSTGNHCHFEVRSNGEAINPLGTLR
jgi:murein DD-endopeptidase MepM/ murein hydrolase activator NlpD